MKYAVPKGSSAVTAITFRRITSELASGTRSEVILMDKYWVIVRRIDSSKVSLEFSGKLWASNMEEAEEEVNYYLDWLNQWVRDDWFPKWWVGQIVDEKKVRKIAQHARFVNYRPTWPAGSFRLYKKQLKRLNNSWLNSA
jgi:hypothetical protein